MDAARAVFEDTMIWEPRKTPVPVDEIINGLDPVDAKMVRTVYQEIEGVYREMPRRRNGDEAFAHPTNVAMFLREAHAQAHVIVAGLMHDVIEDFSDQEGDRKTMTRKERDAGLCLLRAKFAEGLITTSTRLNFPRDVAERIVEVVWTLTRHKADLYYKSISGIFTHPDFEVRLAAALVKLADRMHNIETIENYEEHEQIYQCFKNLFILNNAKRLLNEMRSRTVDARMVVSLEKMFKKNGKATFRALHHIDHIRDANDPLFPLLTYMALALRKFNLEINGLWRVTESKLEPGVPLYNLYDGIVKKYDNRLHREDAEFAAQMQKEQDYCAVTFQYLNLPPEQIRAALYYKDAMALKEVVASLLYREDYLINGFECSRMCRRGRVCLKTDGY